MGQLVCGPFPLAVWSRLVTRATGRVRAAGMNYGGTLGSREFREVIASYLKTARALRREAGQIMVVSGSQQALDLSARVLLDEGSRV